MAHHAVYIHKVNHNACGSVIIQNVGSGSYIATLATGDRARIIIHVHVHIRRGFSLALTCMFFATCGTSINVDDMYISMTTTLHF